MVCYLVCFFSGSASPPAAVKIRVLRSMFVARNVEFVIAWVEFAGADYFEEQSINSVGPSVVPGCRVRGCWLL